MPRYFKINGRYQNGESGLSNVVYVLDDHKHYYYWFPSAAAVYRSSIEPNTWYLGHSCYKDKKDFDSNSLEWTEITKFECLILTGTGGPEIGAEVRYEERDEVRQKTHN